MAAPDIQDTVPVRASEQPPSAPARRAGGPGSGVNQADGSVPPWLFGVAVLVLVTMVVVLSFVTPGFFVTKVFDQVAVQNGVRSILIDDYRIQNVAEVVCPAGQRVLPGRDFTCVTRINNSPAQVRVVIRDSSGRYQVSRPN
jgi:hypothetical protein